MDEQNFENRLRFDKVTKNIKVGSFFEAQYISGRTSFDGGRHGMEFHVAGEL